MCKTQSKSSKLIPSYSHTTFQLIPDRHDPRHKTPFLRSDASSDGALHCRVLYEFLFLVHQADGRRSNGGHCT